MENKTIDTLKGFIIVLIVSGHVVERGMSNYLHSGIFQFIYSFHMPLFMFLCGYVIFGSETKLRGKWLWSMVIGILIPFIIWLIIWSFWDQFDLSQFSFMNGLSGIQAYLLKDISTPAQTPWLLMVLFMFCCILPAVDYIEKYLGYFVFIPFFLILLIVYMRPPGNMWLIYLRWHCVFFFGGYWAAKYREQLPEIDFKKKLLLCIPFIILFAVLHNRAAMYDDATGLSMISGLRFLIAWSGIAASCAFCSMIRLRSISRPLSYLGLYTLDIYVLHLMFIGRGFGNFPTFVLIYRCIYHSLLYLGLHTLDSYAQQAVFRFPYFGNYPTLLFVTLFAILLSLGISKIIRLSPALKLIFFGARKTSAGDDAK
ncbi:MAG: acyltransferase [Smithella sp.]